MTTLHEQFDLLAATLRALIGLLEEADEAFWLPYLRRGLAQVEARQLGGVTYVLGCYGGLDTFSDLEIGQRYRDEEPLRHRNLNARLSQMRTNYFEQANVITSRRSW